MTIPKMCLSDVGWLDYKLTLTRKLNLFEDNNVFFSGAPSCCIKIRLITEEISET